MRSLLRECLFGIRMLKRSPGFTATAVATLAVGIASATTIFSVLYRSSSSPRRYFSTGSDEARAAPSTAS